MLETLDTAIKMLVAETERNNKKLYFALASKTFQKKRKKPAKIIERQITHHKEQLIQKLQCGTKKARTIMRAFSSKIIGFQLEMCLRVVAVLKHIRHFIAFVNISTITTCPLNPVRAFEASPFSRSVVICDNVFVPNFCCLL